MALPWLDNVNRPTQKRRIPSVLTKDEVAGLLAHIDGPAALVARLLYGTGMRLMEGMRLRIKDRVVMLPRSLEPALRLQMLAARAQWEADRQAQRGGVETPHALEQKYPKVGYTWGWFWTFSSPTPSNGARVAGTQRRFDHHDLHPCAQGGGRWNGQSARCAR